MRAKDINSPSNCVRPQVDSGKIRLGIIGCGAITENAHLPAALSSPLVEVTALSDTDESRLRYIQRCFGLQSIGFPNHRDTFAHVDAVILALPNHLHASVGYEFLSRGIHVLCEKPLALSRNECDHLCKAARITKSVLAVGYVTRFFPSTRLTKELIDSGFLGTLISFDYEFGTEGGWAPLSGYNLTRATSGGGVLVVSGSHFIDRMLYLFSDARVISYSDDSRGGVEANCEALFECSTNGALLQGRVMLSKTHKLLNRLCIVGEKGTLEIGEGQSHSVLYFPMLGGIRHEISYVGAVASKVDDDYFKIQLEDFIRAIQSGTEPKITGEQGSASIAVMEKCYEIATPMDEPWVDVLLPWLKAALPPESSESAGAFCEKRIPATSRLLDAN